MPCSTELGNALRTPASLASPTTRLCRESVTAAKLEAAMRQAQTAVDSRSDSTGNSELPDGPWPSYSKKSSSISTICTVRRTCTPTP